MTFLDLIGFVITFLAMIFLFFKRWYDQRARAKNPEEYAKRDLQHQAQVKKFYRALEGRDDEDDEDLAPAPSKKAVHRPPVAKPALSQHSRQPTTSVHAATTTRVQPKYEVLRVRADSRGGKLIHHLASPRDMLIIKEIFDKPLSMRKPDDWGTDVQL